MSKKQPTNTATSVRQRLLNKARADKRTFNELLQYFAIDRFLYRLSHSIHADKFVLKGALMLRAWKSPIFRPTMDIDMLAQRKCQNRKHPINIFTKNNTDTSTKLLILSHKKRMSINHVDVLTGRDAAYNLSFLRSQETFCNLLQVTTSSFLSQSPRYD